MMTHVYIDMRLREFSLTLVIDGRLGQHIRLLEFM
jgi:hypothetical protein